MSKSASDIVNRALTLIDEEPTSFNTAATTETSIREQALEILPEVCRDLVKELPFELKRYLAEIGTLTLLPSIPNQTPYLKQKVTYRLPSNFWELVHMRLSTWSKPVTDYIIIGSKEYSKQNNPYTRAGIQNPVVALSDEYDLDFSSKIIECFSANSDQVVTGYTFSYISFDNVPNDSGNTWPDELFDEITKALATELHIIKSRLNEAMIKGESAVNAIDQHK